MENRNIDEIGITEILNNHKALSACDEIEVVLERFFNSYIENRESAKSEVLTEVNVMLLLALQDSGDYDSKLSENIQKLIEICNNETR